MRLNKLYMTITMQIKKSGNSATLRIPTDVLTQLGLKIGEDVVMQVNDNGFSIEKISHPRDGWADNICPVAALIEAENMTAEYTHLSGEGLDKWENGEIW
ncbi:hypothetical protein C9J19_07990 [Photobacterium phosphoreum]|jgi:antitoxin component of MazEF toxin-antitoxin module|nr:hypothetical protein C9J19_07990 [Photobacterium phosphoreum]